MVHESTSQSTVSASCCVREANLDRSGEAELRWDELSEAVQNLGNSRGADSGKQAATGAREANSTAPHSRAPIAEANTRGSDGGPAKIANHPGHGRGRTQSGVGGTTNCLRSQHIHPQFSSHSLRTRVCLGSHPVTLVLTLPSEV